MMVSGDMRMRMRMRMMGGDARTFGFLHAWDRKACERTFITLPPVKNRIISHSFFILDCGRVHLLDQVRLLARSSLAVRLRTSLRAFCSYLCFPVGVDRHQWTGIWSTLRPTETLLSGYPTRGCITCKAGRILALERSFRSRRRLGSLYPLRVDRQLAVTDLPNHLRWLTVRRLLDIFVLLCT